MEIDLYCDMVGHLFDFRRFRLEKLWWKQTKCSHIRPMCIITKWNWFNEINVFDTFSSFVHICINNMETNSIYWLINGSSHIKYPSSSYECSLTKYPKRKTATVRLTSSFGRMTNGTHTEKYPKIGVFPHFTHFWVNWDHSWRKKS